MHVRKRVCVESSTWVGFDGHLAPTTSTPKLSRLHDSSPIRKTHNHTTTGDYSQKIEFKEKVTTFTAVLRIFICVRVGVCTFLDIGHKNPEEMMSINGIYKLYYTHLPVCVHNLSLNIDLAHRLKWKRFDRWCVINKPTLIESMIWWRDKDWTSHWSNDNPICPWAMPHRFLRFLKIIIVNRPVSIASCVIFQNM